MTCDASSDARSHVLDPEGLPDHIDRLYRAACALCGSRQDAEDLVHAFDSVENAQLQSDAGAKLMDKIGPSVALTNSAGGLRAILTALKTDNLAGIVMYENVGYVYPQGEGPGGPVGVFGPVEVPLEEFKKLTKVPMQMVWGDNIDKAGNYSSSYKLAVLFAEKVNKYGGKAEVLKLTDAGLKGNTHIPFADMNNVAVADLLSKFLAKHGLDKR